MFLNGDILNWNTDIKSMIAKIQKIGVNVNQIARRVNTTGTPIKRI